MCKGASQLRVSVAKISAHVVNRCGGYGQTKIIAAAGVNFRAEHLGFDLTLMQTALDQVDYVFVLLDRDLSSRFINRAFRHIWQLPNEKADNGPTFAELVQHGRDTKAYAVPSGQIDAYVSQRIELVAAGNVPRLDLRLSGGRVVRLECKPLPDGARVLTYFDVTGMIPKTPASEATDIFLTQAPLPAHMQPGGLGASAVSWQVRRTEQFIEVNWDQPLTMDEIASAVGASKRSIFRAFQRARGYSPQAGAATARTRLIGIRRREHDRHRCRLQLRLQ